MKNFLFQKLTLQDGETYNVPGCKNCGFGGELEDGRKVFFWNTHVKSVDFGNELMVKTVKAIK